tara:strand:- start:5618 stop:6739 length:1122 start_codon:yes stop_codon:yes gene_type:complete
MKLEKIIIFYPSFERGGVELILANLINFFLKKKVCICLISSNFNKKIIKKNRLFTLKEHKDQNINFINNRITNSLYGVNTLLKELKSSNPKKTIVFSMQSSSLSIILCKILNFKIVVRNAEDPIYSTFYKENKLLSLFVLALKIITYNFADGIITNSKGSKQSLERLLFRKTNIDYIYNPYLKKINKRNFLKRKKYILSVGRLTKQKDFNNLILSFNIIAKNIPDYKLIIVGGGNLKTKLKDLGKKLNLEDKIIFTGWKKKVSKYYKHASIFILPSLYEGLGNVVIDAVNYEIPTIITNCKSGPNEIIMNNKGGYIVPKSNPEILASKIIYVLKNYTKAKNKILYAKKNIYRFEYQKNSLKYLNFIKNVFYGK